MKSTQFKFLRSINFFYGLGQPYSVDFFQLAAIRQDKNHSLISEGRQQRGLLTGSQQSEISFEGTFLFLYGHKKYFHFQDEGLVIQCLIKSRDDHQDLDDKCVAAVEHWQILSMKDWRFSYQFKESCKKDIQEHCFSMNAGKNKLIIGLVLKALRALK